MDLQDYRSEIDRVNQEIVKDVAKRVNVVEEIYSLKKEKEMEKRDDEREEVLRQQFEKLFRREGLPEEKGRELADLLIETGLEACERKGVDQK